MKWTHAKMAELVKLFRDNTNEELAEHFDVSIHAIHSQACRQGLYRNSHKVPKKEHVTRWPAIYTNKNSYSDLLNKYAPI